MSQSYRLQTPEYVEFSYDVAGIGSRFLAALADTAILAGAVGAVAVAAAWVGGMTGSPAPLLSGGATTVAQSVVAAAATLLIFALIFGYYIYFEMAWNGQSPGKRWAGLRVVRGTGYPITFVDSVLRNVVRLIDFLPAFYALGVVVMIADARSRRLGDLVAGTMVVKERRVSLDGISSSAAVPSAAPPDLFELPNADRLTADDLRLVRGFLDRRGTLAPERRRALARQISDALMSKLETREVIYDREVFLEQIAAQER
jgi:uncharacterized RDD family membrane protein YckC